jgi:uncharacterized flavoprotein (TIGR03862 family)
MESPDTRPKPAVVVYGAGPAGLMAAEILSARGIAVTVYERMPTPGRKFLMAGRGGLNLSHAEPFEPFLSRYGTAAAWLRPILEAFPPSALLAWAEGLSQPTFVGSSGRVFPREMKASPLLRAWLMRLADQNVRIVTRAEWHGWSEDSVLTIHRQDGTIETPRPDAVVLALGGASWPKLGGDGAWVPALRAREIAVAPLRPANCSFTVAWSPIFRDRFAGQPVKTVSLSHEGMQVPGEAMITRDGIEGGAVYVLSASLRDAIARDGATVLHLDLRPETPLKTLADRLAEPRRGRSLAETLRKATGLSPLAINLMRESCGNALPAEPQALAALIKDVPIHLTAPGGLARAISTAGGVSLDALDERLMLRAMPGVFVAGEMLDWEAPTGGYLLQACFATGVAAAEGALAWLARGDRVLP